MGVFAMGSVRKRNESGLLFFDFRYGGLRCREQTALKDTKANRQKLQRILGQIEMQIKAGVFDYSAMFPGSKALRKLGSPDFPESVRAIEATVVANSSASVPSADLGDSDFEDFANLWFGENEVTWRRSQKKTNRGILNKHLIPAFGGQGVGRITKAEILAFRSQLAKVPGRKGTTLSPKRINSVMGVLRQILNEAADRFDFSSAYRNIKPLKVPKSDVQPFTLDEVNQVINKVRADFRYYYTVRFFTGLRTGEIDGLKWEYIDFENLLILVRETIVAGEEDYTKTDGSQREIQMSQVVYDALKAQEKLTRRRSKYVFCNGNGEPLDHNNVTKRIWYPLLRHLGLKERRPYQTRHTAATLWLASGENPEWIARQMGHSSTEMLFRVYARYVPNLTRRDGSAFERLLASKLDLGGGHDDIS